MLPTKRVHNFGTYFITANCAEKRPVFQVERTAQLLFDVLQHYRNSYKLHCFAIMPNHIHLILTPADGTTLERCMQLIKGGFSHRYHQAGGQLLRIWQRGFADHRIRDRADYETRKNYVEMNPVRAGLCLQPQDYAWSSASRILRERLPSAAKASE